MIEADRKWSREVAGKFPGCRLGAKRHIMHELIAQRARVVFDDVEGARIVETNKGHFLLYIAARGAAPPIVLRFKHLDNYHRTRNYPTKGSLRFDRQQSLPGVPSGLRLNVGYTLDLADAALTEILVTRAIGSRLIWQYPIWKRGAEIIEFRTQENFPFRDTERRRARPKDLGESESAETEQGD